MSAGPGGSRGGSAASASGAATSASGDPTSAGTTAGSTASSTIRKSAFAVSILAFVSVLVENQVLAVFWYSLVMGNSRHVLRPDELGNYSSLAHS